MTEYEFDVRGGAGILIGGNVVPGGGTVNAPAGGVVTAPGGNVGAVAPMGGGAFPGTMVAPGGGVVTAPGGRLGAPPKGPLGLGGGGGMNVAEPEGFKPG